MGVIGNCLANPETVVIKSALVWRTDTQGDFIFDPISSSGTYEISPAYTTAGRIASITASWKFKGEVRLELSADNGDSYTPVLCGVPLTSGFVKGNNLRWRVTLGADSELTEVRISYTDTSGLVGTFGEPQLSGFELRKPLVITNAGDNDLFNYQLQINVGELTGQDADVYCEGNIQADFADLRFTCADGQTLLAHYLEKIAGTAPNRLATIWVKIPQIPKEGLALFMYYGNSQAEDISSAEDVFDFFDGFTGDDLDLTKWELKQGVYLVSDSQLKLESAEIFSKDYLIKDGIVEYRARAGTGNEVRLIARGEKDDLLAGANQVAYSSNYLGAEHCLAIGDIVKANQARAITSGTTYDYRLSLKDTNLIFQRYSEGYQQLQAEAVYDDIGGLTSGSIGLKAGTDCTNYFEWVRVRRYSPYEVAVDKQAAQLAMPEQIGLSDFYGVTLSGNGNLILRDDYLQGLYTSRTVTLADEARIFVPSYVVTDASSLSDEAISLDVSMDAGQNYAANCAQGDFYYASKDDFTVGDAWKFKLSLQGSELISPQLSEVGVDYRPGRILLITPNGREIWPPQQQKEIAWAALEYEPGYEMKLEYSLNVGQTYTEITKTTKNTGTYLWTTPGVESNSALVRISDALEPSVFDICDEPFTISAEEEVVEEAVVEETVIAMRPKVEEDVSLDHLTETSKRPGTTLYDVLIKLGDNHNPDPEEDERACYKEGDVVVVRPTGYLWGAEEVDKFLIVQLYLTETEAHEITRPKEISTGKVDESGRPVMRTMRRRAKRIDLNKLGFSKGAPAGERVQKLRTLRNTLKGRALKKQQLIEEK